MRWPNALLVVAFLSSNALGDEELRKQFLKEAPSAWREFQEQHRPTHVEFSWHTINKETGKDEVVITTEIRRSKEAILVLSRDQVHETVVAKTGEYGYKARIPIGEASWNAEMIGPVTKPLEDYLDQWGYRWLDFPVAPAGVRMLELIDLEGVTIDSIEWVNEDKQPKRVRFAFSCAQGYRDLPGVDEPIESGIVTMTPSRLWTIDKAVLQTPVGEVTMSFEYEQDQAGKLIVLNNEVRILSKQGDETVVNRIYDQYSYVPLDKSAFSAAQFGLPVPDEAEAGSYWRLVGSVAALGASFIAVATLIRWRQKKTS